MGEEGSDNEEEYDAFAELPAPHVRAAMIPIRPKATVANTALPKALPGAGPKASQPLSAATAKGPPSNLTSPMTVSQSKAPTLASPQISTTGIDPSLLATGAPQQSKAAALLGLPLPKHPGALPPGPPTSPAPLASLGQLPPGPPPEPGVAVKAPPPNLTGPLGPPVGPLGPLGPELPGPLNQPLLGLGPLGLDLGPLPLPPLLPTPGLAPAAPTGPSVLWEANLSPQGVPYYYCKATGESRWVKPTGPQDVVVEAAASSQPQGKSTAALAAEATARGGPAALKEAMGEPKSWEPIAKTGWLQVTTTKGFKYYFQKKKKITSWEVPPEIADEVAKLEKAAAAKTARPAPKAESAPKASATPATASATATASAASAASAAAAAAAAAAAPAAPKAAPETAAPAATVAPAAAAPPAAPAAAPEAANEISALGTSAPSKPSKLDREKERQKEQATAKEKQRLLNFKQLLIEKGVRSFDKYEKWLPKLMHDPRFTAITNQAERKAVFAAYAKRIDADRHKQELDKKHAGRDGLKELLKQIEESGWLDNKTKHEAMRLIDRKFGEDPRWTHVKEADRERYVGEAVEDLAKRRKKQQDEAQAAFRALSLELLRGKAGPKGYPDFRSLEKTLRKDPRWQPVDCTSTRERLFREVVRELETAKRERERQVQRDHDEVEQLRKKRKTTAAEESLTNLLAERVKAPYATTWEEVSEVLGEHPDMRDSPLSPQERERVFAEYRRAITEQRGEEFLQFLSSLPTDVAGPDMEFEEVLESALDEAAAKAFAGMPEDVLRSAFAEWREQAWILATDTARLWLRSCQLLTGCEAIVPGTADFGALIQKLNAADIRWRRLAVRPSQQQILLEERLMEMKERRQKGKNAIGEDVGDE